MSLNTPTSPKPVSGFSVTDEALAVRDRLLVAIGEDNDLPALGSSVSRVVQLASSDDEAVRNLAHFVLSDVALTQKILRLANTAYYISASGTPVTTVSKAIFLLGFDTVKTSALAMLLVDGMSGKRAASVRAELSLALSASVVGRELARRSHFKDAEEAAIAALFKNIGKLLVAAHDPVLYGEVARLTESGLPVRQASTQVLGCSFDSLAESVLREWQIPETIVLALNPLPSGPLKPAKTRQEWMQQVAAFSAAAVELLPKTQQPGGEVASRALLERFGTALNLDQERLQELFETVSVEVSTLSEQANLTRSKADIVLSSANLDFGVDYPDEDGTGAELGLPSELLMTSDRSAVSTDNNARHPSGKPFNARDQLMSGVQDVTEMMASGRCKVNDLIMLVLETIYHGMGFRFATVCIKDVKSAQFRARIALGERNAERQAGFTFPEAPMRDLFHLAMQNDADLMISDATSPKIRDLIPAWHRSLLPDARSFIVLPLLVQKKQFGLFYADRAQAAPEGVPPDETALIKTLKGQVLSALNSR